MRKLYLDNGNEQFKFADTETVICLNAYDDGCLASLTSNAKVRVKNDSGYLLEVSAIVTNNRAVITSGQLAQLPAGRYLLELWDTENGGTVIYPSDGFLTLQINENVTGLSGNIVSSITVEDFIKQFSELSQQLKEKISNVVITGSKGGSSIVVDKSLSISGAAADAKKTGDALSKRLSSYGLVNNNDKYKSINDLPWNGAYVVFNNTVGIIPTDTPYEVNVAQGALVLTVNTDGIAKTQLWIPLDDEHDIYTRYTVEGVGFSEWKRSLENALSNKLSSHNLVFNNDKYKSINNLPWNGAYVVFNNTAGTIPADTPYEVNVAQGALVLTVNTDGIAKTQLWIPLDDAHDIYTRYTVEGVGFSEWKRPLGGELSKRLSSYDLIFNNDKYKSINNLPWNGAYVVFNNTAGTIPADTPYEVDVAKGALVLTVNTDSVAKTQLWIPLDNEHDIYTRYTQIDESFTQWQKISATNATLHVGEGQKYTSLKEALSNAEDGDTIILHGGTYNPYNEGLTTDGYQINKSIHLKGVNSAKIMASLESPNDDYSPLNLKAPNVDVTIENIAIEATNCRYCVHDEQGGGGSQGGYHVYRNCHMINHSLKGALRLPRCIGSGMCGNEVLVVDSCVFELADSTLSANDFHTDWKVTTDGRQNGDAKAIVKNSVCKTNKICTLSFPGGNRDTGKVYGYFSGNLTKELPDSNDSELCPATQWNNSIYSE